MIDRAAPPHRTDTTVYREGSSGTVTAFLIIVSCVFWVSFTSLAISFFRSAVTMVDMHEDLRRGTSYYRFHAGEVVPRAEHSRGGGDTCLCCKPVHEQMQAWPCSSPGPFFPGPSSDALSLGIRSWAPMEGLSVHCSTSR